MAIDIRAITASAFVNAAAHARAAQYCEQARVLREMAEREPRIRLRDRLHELADEYAELAARMIAPR